MRPRRRLLACRGGLQDQRIGVPAADDLQRHRQPLGGESTRHAGGWLSRQVERKGERQTVEHRRRWGAVDGAWAALYRPRRQRHLRGEQQVVSIEQAPHLVVELGARQLRQAQLHGGNPLPGLDHFHQAGLEPLGPPGVALGVTRREGNVPGHGCGLALVVPAGIDGLDLAAEVAETLGCCSGRTPHLRVYRGVAQVDAPGDAQPGVKQSSVASIAISHHVKGNWKENNHAFCLI